VRRCFFVDFVKMMVKFSKFLTILNKGNFFKIAIRRKYVKIFSKYW